LNREVNMVFNYFIIYSLREKNIRAIIKQNVRAVENRFNSGKRFEDAVTVYEIVKYPIHTKLLCAV